MITHKWLASSFFAIAVVAAQGTWTARQVPTLTPEQAEILQHLSIVYLDDGQGGAAKTIRITGVNVQVVNGSGTTGGTADGTGNVIIGYNEPGNINGDDRTGSHNLVCGQMNSYSYVGGVVFGTDNTASGYTATVLGGIQNTASGSRSVVVGGSGNSATEFYSTVCGGVLNVASGVSATVSGGVANLASGQESSVSGGRANQASGEISAVSGGHLRTASGQYDWAAGSLLEDQ